MKKPSRLPEYKRTRTFYEWGHWLVSRVLALIIVAFALMLWLGLDSLLPGG